MKYSAELTVSQVPKVLPLILWQEDLRLKKEFCFTAEKFFIEAVIFMTKNQTLKKEVDRELRKDRVRWTSIIWAVITVTLILGGNIFKTHLMGLPSYVAEIIFTLALLGPNAIGYKRLHCDDRSSNSKEDFVHGALLAAAGLFIGPVFGSIIQNILLVSTTHSVAVSAGTANLLPVEQGAIHLVMAFLVLVGVDMMIRAVSPWYRWFRCSEYGDPRSGVRSF